MVGEEGVEPSRGFPHSLLKTARLPFRHPPLERETGFEPAIFSLATRRTTTVLLPPAHVRKLAICLEQIASSRPLCNGTYCGAEGRSRTDI